MLAVQPDDLADAKTVNALEPAGKWTACGAVDLALEARRLLVQIPTGFGDMMAGAPDLALAWRMTTRRIFTTLFSRGYQAVDFFLNRSARNGAYLLVRKDD